eukprot:g80490.t1
MCDHEFVFNQETSGTFCERCGLVGREHSLYGAGQFLVNGRMRGDEGEMTEQPRRPQGYTRLSRFREITRQVFGLRGIHQKPLVSQALLQLARDLCHKWSVNGTEMTPVRLSALGVDALRFERSAELEGIIEFWTEHWGDYFIFPKNSKMRVGDFLRKTHTGLQGSGSFFTSNEGGRAAFRVSDDLRRLPTGGDWEGGELTFRQALYGLHEGSVEGCDGNTKPLRDCLLVHCRMFLRYPDDVLSYAKVLNDLVDAVAPGAKNRHQSYTEFRQWLLGGEDAEGNLQTPFGEEIGQAKKGWLTYDPPEDDSDEWVLTAVPKPIGMLTADTNGILQIFRHMRALIDRHLEYRALNSGGQKLKPADRPPSDYTSTADLPPPQQQQPPQQQKKKQKTAAVSAWAKRVLDLPAGTSAVAALGNAEAMTVLNGAGLERCFDYLMKHYSNSTGKKDKPLGNKHLLRALYGEVTYALYVEGSLVSRPLFLSRVLAHANQDLNSQLFYQQVFLVRRETPLLDTVTDVNVKKLIQGLMLQSSRLAAQYREALGALPRPAPPPLPDRFCTLFRRAVFQIEEFFLQPLWSVTGSRGCWWVNILSGPVTGTVWSPLLGRTSRPDPSSCSRDCAVLGVGSVSPAVLVSPEGTLEWTSVGPIQTQYYPGGTIGVEPLIRYLVDYYKKVKKNREPDGLVQDGGVVNHYLRKTEEYRQKKAAILDDDADEIGKGPASGVNRKKKAAQRLDSYKRWQERKAKSNKESKETKKYRDRAQERRAGKDSAFTEEELEKYKSLSYEQSKFLGGDMEHTHLMKGLDFALVAKKREELERLEEARLESAATSNDIAKKKEEEPEVETANLPQFASTLARNLYNWTQNQRAERIGPVDYFLKGRMTFEFDLDPEFSKSVPTTIIHPMTDVEQEGDRIPGLVDRTVLKKMAKIMTLMREGSLSLKKKKKKKKDAGMEDDENIEEEIRRQAMLEEVDMFAANAASASKVKADNEAPSAAANSKTAGNYFDGPSVLKQAETEYSDAQDKAKAAESEPEDKKTKAKTTEDKKKDPMQVEEYYEAYPSYGGLSDDDEDDLSKMDQGRGRDRLRPWDFDTEGEWESYNSNREANPKAAFQFEQGEAESRKREQRFNADFQKITALMKKRDKAMGKTTVQSSAVDSERAQKRQKILSGFRKQQ